MVDNNTTAVDVPPEIKQEMVDDKDIDRDFDNLRPNPVITEHVAQYQNHLVYKQPRTVSHQQILTTESNPREMTLTKKAMQVASMRDPSNKPSKNANNIAHQSAAYQKRVGGVMMVRNSSEAKPVLNDLLEDRKVLSRSLAET